MEYLRNIPVGTAGRKEAGGRLEPVTSDLRLGARAGGGGAVVGGTAKGWELGGPARIPEGVVRAETPVPGREERELSLSGLRWERSRPALWGRDRCGEGGRVSGS